MSRHIMKQILSKFLETRKAVKQVREHLCKLELRQENLALELRMQFTDEVPNCILYDNQVIIHNPEWDGKNSAAFEVFEDVKDVKRRKEEASCVKGGNI